jgi:hypothetical protein
MSLYSEVLGNGGRLGNQLFNYAALIGMADKHGHKLALPEWKYAEYFDYEFPSGEANGFEYHETTFHYNQEYVNGLKDIETDYNLKGYFQSILYWEHCEDKVKAALKFKPDFIQQVRNDFEQVFDKQTIAISVRRGDYRGNPNYRLLPVAHYIHALFEHFPDWQEYNIIFFSDDVPWCRVHFDCLPNAYFSENNSDIEDICLMTQCDHFLVANSTFSWFGAYLGEKPHSKVIHSVHHFEGDLKRKCDVSTYYPKRWIPFDYEGRKLDLKDVTFTIPVFYDHPDRKQNLDLSVCLLQHYFDTNIIVQENKSAGLEHIAEYVDYYQSNHPVFHRTKMLNEMAEIATTDIIVNWDCDIILPPLQIWKAVQAIRKGADMVFPYDGRFARMPRQVWYKDLCHWLDIGIIGNTQFNGMGSNDNHNSVGGAVFWNKESNLKAGGENENFISFGAEDQERVIRAEKLGLRIERIKGCLYHLNHWVGVNSTTSNPYFIANREEFEKVKEMSKDELLDYIKNWDEKKQN